MDGRGPSTWAIFCCTSRRISRELDQESGCKLVLIKDVCVAGSSLTHCTVVFSIMRCFWWLQADRKQDINSWIHCMWVEICLSYDSYLFRLDSQCQVKRSPSQWTICPTVKTPLFLCPETYKWETWESPNRTYWITQFTLGRGKLEARCLRTSVISVQWLCCGPGALSFLACWLLTSCFPGRAGNRQPPEELLWKAAPGHAARSPCRADGRNCHGAKHWKDHSQDLSLFCSLVEQHETHKELFSPLALIEINIVT